MVKIKRGHWLLMLACCALLTAFGFLATAPVLAQEPITDNDVNRVAKQLYCPTCENTPVDVCPTQTCSDWREEIRTQLAAGRSDAEIIDYFATQFGSQVRVNPPREGFGLLIWIAPAVIVLIGLIIFGRYFKNLSGRQPTPGSPPAELAAPAQDDYRARIEAELREDV